jgi:hypothetical protein
LISSRSNSNAAERIIAASIAIRPRLAAARASGVAPASTRRRFCAGPAARNCPSATIWNAGRPARAAGRRSTRAANRMILCTSRHDGKRRFFPRAARCQTPHDVCSYVAKRKPTHDSLTSVGVFMLDYSATHRPSDGHFRPGHGQRMFMSQQQDRWIMRDIRTRRTTSFKTDGTAVCGG